MNERIEYLCQKANKLPLTPGVYQMKDSGGKIIYIGKAKALKNRVTSYFRAIESHNAKTYRLVQNIYDFDFIVTPTELDALVLEASLIKLHNPKYNILLKDDKGYNYIKISGEEYPKITYALQTDDKKAEYIGPYTSGYTVKQAIEEANRLFMLPTCTRKFPKDFGKERPCLNFHIGRCMGVCKGKISPEEYRKNVDQAVNYIKNGSKESIERLTKEMEDCAEKLEFEKAARLRDRISAIQKAELTQHIYSSKTTDYDIVAAAVNMDQCSVAVVKYRGGRLIDKENFFIGQQENDSQTREEFLVEYYSNKSEMPKEIYIDAELEGRELLESYFAEKFGHKIGFVTPKRGEGLTQLILAKSNAEEYLSLRVGRTSREISALEDLRKILGLEKTPEIIESYDISNMGEETRVAGMVVFKNGRPFKQGYKKFNIKYVRGIDDYACMQEIIERRFNRYLEGDESFAPLPDLILLDGGKGHVAAVKQVLDRMGINAALYGLVKDDKHRTRAIAKEGGEIQINGNKNVFDLLTRIQDEVHRFSINFQRKQHKKKQYELEIMRIKGIGEAKAVALLKEFKTKKAMKAATLEQLMQTAKINRETAEELYLFIQETF
ncbi:MAG: excinuclease ABC subunit UvrC [Firmicutes bacterium]|nr:excinuclease ABC subunit UvrC [[Eubacterium] siraeum]MCM1488755.1 excinuclease ABC subunit UvrC [Bacillota bacterium]